ncbi:MAG: VanZ family protein [Lachnospiraceae bacterium]|nr:VanZ family protein [Lachnospiraceae bacterium]
MDNREKAQIRILTAICMVLYLLLLFYVCFFSEAYRAEGAADYRYNLVPFREIIRFYSNIDSLGFRAVFDNLLGNVIAFIPFGFFYPIIIKRHSSFWRTFFGALCLSLIIETIQFLTKVGAFDVDDLILNTFGGVLGYLLFKLVNRIRRSHLG